MFLFIFIRNLAQLQKEQNNSQTRMAEAAESSERFAGIVVDLQKAHNDMQKELVDTEALQSDLTKASVSLQDKVAKRDAERNELHKLHTDRVEELVVLQRSMEGVTKKALDYLDMIVPLLLGAAKAGLMPGN